MCIKGTDKIKMYELEFNQKSRLKLTCSNPNLSKRSTVKIKPAKEPMPPSC